jgi:hypothetical protein
MASCDSPPRERKREERERSMDVTIQAEVIPDDGVRNPAFYHACIELAQRHGSQLHGNSDLSKQRYDPNSFHVFYDPAAAEAFQREVFRSGLSHACYLTRLSAAPDGSIRSESIMPWGLV